MNHFFLVSLKDELTCHQTSLTFVVCLWVGLLTLWLHRMLFSMSKCTCICKKQPFFNTNNKHVLQMFNIAWIISDRFELIHTSLHSSLFSWLVLKICCKSTNHDRDPWITRFSNRQKKGQGDGQQCSKFQRDDDGCDKCDEQQSEISPSADSKDKLKILW